VLEEVRMLSNLETARGKLIQILLVGQPELGEKLGRPELRQLRQRISLVAELKPLSYEDTVRYIAHRLDVAGLEGGRLFSRRALKSSTSFGGTASSRHLRQGARLGWSGVKVIRPDHQEVLKD
jgi:type II secretory pathway predicted ATPase ExeA